MMMSDLSDDLVEEILSRIPATSLKHLRLTCKQWNSLFNDRKFAKKHFDKAPRDFLFFMLKDSKLFSINLNLHEISNKHFVDPAMKVLGDASLVNDHIYIGVSHCNGLLLCATEDNRLIVWNPCTGRTRRITYSTRPGRTNNFSLGYETAKYCHRYKILRRSDNREGYWCTGDEVVEFEIYDCISDSWMVLDSALTFKFAIRDDNSVSLMGNRYWLASEDYGSPYHYKHLVVFNFTTEKFESLNFPDQNFEHVALSLSVVEEDKLIVLYHRWDMSKTEFWVSTVDKNDQTKVLEWRKFLVLNEPYMFGGWDSIFFDETNKFTVCFFFKPGGDGTAFVFGHGDKYIEIPFEEKSIDTALIPFVFNYVPSLVQI